MTEDLVTFDTAKLAKEKGFDIDVRTYYNVPTNKKEKPYLETESDVSDDYNRKFYEEPQFVNSGRDTYTFLSAPSQSLLQKWLRTKDIHIDHMYNPRKKLHVFYIHKSIDNDLCNSHTVKTIEFEIGLEMVLLEGLKFIK